MGSNSFLFLSQLGDKVNALMVDMTYGTVRSVGELLTLSGTKDHIIDLLYMKDNIIACSLHHGERAAPPSLGLPSSLSTSAPEEKLHGSRLTSKPHFQTSFDSVVYLAIQDASAPPTLSSLIGTMASVSNAPAAEADADVETVLSRNKVSVTIQSMPRVFCLPSV